MENLLIVSASESGKRNIAALLRPFPFQRTLYASSAAEARRALSSPAAPALVVINAPLPDEPGRRLALSIAENSPATVLLLVKSDCFPIALAETEEGGIFLLQKPFHRNDFSRAVKQGLAFQKRISAMHAENERLRRQLAESRTISRAKCMLIQFFHMTEEEAHHYIERAAMNRRQNKYDVAASLLQSLENNGAQSHGLANLVDFLY